MGDRKDLIKFGPEWLRNLSSERNTDAGNATSRPTASAAANTRHTRTFASGPPPHTTSTAVTTATASHHSGQATGGGSAAAAAGTFSSNHSSSKVQLAKLRYGREEMLALFDTRSARAPAELKHNDVLYLARGKAPFALVTFEDSRQNPRASGMPLPEFNSGRVVCRTPLSEFSPGRAASRTPLGPRVRAMLRHGTGRGAGVLEPRPSWNTMNYRSSFPPPTAEEPPGSQRPWNNSASGNRLPGEHSDWHNKVFKSKRPGNSTTNWRQAHRDEGGDEWRSSDLGRSRSNNNLVEREWGDRNRRTWASGDPRSAHDELPEWFDNPDAGAGTFDASGAFHGASADDANDASDANDAPPPKAHDSHDSHETAHALTRSHTHTSFERSRNLEDNSQEADWWVSDKARKLSDKSPAQTQKVRQRPAAPAKASMRMRRSESYGSLEEIPVKLEKRPGSSNANASASANANASASAMFKPQFERKAFNPLGRTDMEKGGGGQAGNFQSVMITSNTNNSLRQKHQNLVPPSEQQKSDEGAVDEMLHFPLERNVATVASMASTVTGITNARAQSSFAELMNMESRIPFELAQSLRCNALDTFMHAQDFSNDALFRVITPNILANSAMNNIAAGDALAGSGTMPTSALAKAALGSSAVGSSAMGSAAMGGSAMRNAAMGGSAMENAAMGGSAMRSAAMGGSAMGSVAMGGSTMGSATIGNAVICSPSMGSAAIGNAVMGGTSMASAAIGNASMGSVAMGSAAMANAAMGGAAMSSAAMANAAMGSAAMSSAAMGSAAMGSAAMANAAMGSAARANAAMGSAAMANAAMGSAAMANAAMGSAAMANAAMGSAAMANAAMGSAAMANAAMGSAAMANAAMGSAARANAAMGSAAMANAAMGSAAMANAAMGSAAMANAAMGSAARANAAMGSAAMANAAMGSAAMANAAMGSAAMANAAMGSAARANAAMGSAAMANAAMGSAAMANAAMGSAAMGSAMPLVGKSVLGNAGLTNAVLGHSITNTGLGGPRMMNPTMNNIGLSNAGLTNETIPLSPQNMQIRGADYQMLRAMEMQGLQHPSTSSAYNALYGNVAHAHGMQPDLSDHEWYYEDPEKNIQGPFSSAEMYYWFSAGFFNNSMLVRRSCDPEMRPLGSYGPMPFVTSGDSMHFASLDMDIMGNPPFGRQPIVDGLWAQPNNANLAWMQPRGFWSQRSGISLPEEIAKEMKTEDEILAQLRASQVSESAKDTNRLSSTLGDLHNIIQLASHSPATTLDGSKITAVSESQGVAEEKSAVAAESSEGNKQVDKPTKSKENNNATSKSKSKKSKEDKREEEAVPEAKGKEDEIGQPERQVQVPLTPKAFQKEKASKKENEKIWCKDTFALVKGADKGSIRDLRKKAEEAKVAEEAERKRKEEERLAADEEKKRKQAELVRKQQEAQQRELQQRASESAAKRAPWSAPPASAAASASGAASASASAFHPSLADIQRLEREKKLEQHHMMALLAQHQAAALARDQEMQTSLGWAKKATATPVNAPSLADIQAETRRQAATESSAQQASAQPQEEAPQAAPRANNGPGAGFWESIRGASKNKGKKKSTAVGTKEAGAAKEPGAAAEFDAWCNASLSTWSSNIDVPTFVNFLKDIESPYEVKDYVKCYLGETKEANDFARNFLERRSKLMRVGMETPSDDLCSPAAAVNPRPSTASDYQEVKVKGKRSKKNKMLKVDARILGFSVTASEDRINVGDIDMA